MLLLIWPTLACDLDSMIFSQVSKLILSERIYPTELTDIKIENTLYTMVKRKRKVKANTTGSQTSGNIIEYVHCDNSVYLQKLP